MNYSFNKTLRLIILLFLLGNGALLFFHSELGLFNCENDNHNAHDYCEIIKITNTHNNILKDIQPSFEVAKTHFLQYAIEADTQILLACLCRSEEHIIYKQSIKTYLFNQSFLI
jgi:hypothetical protein